MEFTCCALTDEIELSMVRRAFGLDEEEPRWRDRVVVSGENLSYLFPADEGGRALHIFRSGCVVFEGLTAAELPLALRRLSQILPDADYRTAVNHWDSLTTQMIEYDARSQAARRAASDIVPEYLAKSVKLSVLSDEIDSLLENEEVLIRRLARGKSWLNVRFTSRIRMRLICFEYKALSHAQLLDIGGASETSRHAALQIQLNDHLELISRVQVFRAKLQQLQRLLGDFSEDRFHQTMINCYRYEVALLIIFPVLHFVPTGLSMQNIVHWLSALFGG